MHHIAMEELARLVDEQPTAPDHEHLAVCSKCADRLQELRQQAEALASLSTPPVPADQWSGIEAALAAEGVIRNQSSDSFGPFRRIAAAIAIFVAGSLAGGTAVSLWTAAPEAQFVMAPATVTDAEQAVRDAERNYLDAVENYSLISEPDGVVDPASRLAALEGILLTTRSALNESPGDPVINNYHLTALGQRDALVRQLVNARAEQEWF